MGWISPGGMAFHRAGGASPGESNWSTPSPSWLCLIAADLRRRATPPRLSVPRAGEQEQPAPLPTARRAGSAARPARCSAWFIRSERSAASSQRCRGEHVLVLTGGREGGQADDSPRPPSARPPLHFADPPPSPIRFPADPVRHERGRTAPGRVSTGQTSAASTAGAPCGPQRGSTAPRLLLLSERGSASPASAFTGRSLAIVPGFTDSCPAEGGTPDGLVTREQLSHAAGSAALRRPRHAVAARDHRSGSDQPGSPSVRRSTRGEATPSRSSPAARDREGRGRSPAGGVRGQPAAKSKAATG